MEPITCFISECPTRRQRETGGAAPSGLGPSPFARTGCLRSIISARWLRFPYVEPMDLAATTKGPNQFWHSPGRTRPANSSLEDRGSPADIRRKKMRVRRRHCSVLRFAISMRSGVDHVDGSSRRDDSAHVRLGRRNPRDGKISRTIAAEAETTLDMSSVALSGNLDFL